MHGIVSYKFEYKLGSETDYKLGKEIDSFKNTCDYTYIGLTQEVVNNLKVTATDNKGNTKEAILDVTPEKLGITITEEGIGKTVDYMPIGGEYSTMKNGIEQSGYGNEQIFKTQGKNTSETMLTWKIFKVDSSNLHIISDRPTDSKLILKGVSGYNNGVKILNDLCNQCYSNEQIYNSNIIVRSFRLSDILGENGEVRDIIKTPEYGNSYGLSRGPFTGGSVPSIWYSNDKNASYSSIISRETDNDYVGSQTNMQSYGNITETLWLKPFLKKELFSNTAYYDMIIGTSTNNSYWLGTRYFSGDRCPVAEFGLQYINSSSINSSAIYQIDTTHSYEQSLSIRPYIIIPISSCKLTEGGANGEDYHIDLIK